MKNKVGWLLCMAFLCVVLAGVVASRIESRDQIILGGSEGTFVQTDTYAYPVAEVTPEPKEGDDGWPVIDITEAQYRMVNDDTEFLLPSSFEPVCGVVDGTKFMMFDVDALPYLNAMLHAAEEAGYTPYIAAAYRTYSYQTQMFNAMASALSGNMDYMDPRYKEYAEQALKFFHKLSSGEGFLYDKTTDLSQYTDEQLAEYDVQIWLNNSVHGEKERKAFERYMENGGGWIGFHAAAYNDKNTRWPWFVNFLGGGVFYCNNWPPQPALVMTDTDQHTVTKSLPREFVIPSSEWYQWNPSPRKNPDVEVLLSITPKNYPLGIKDVVKFGDFPIVWTNKKYRMVYLNGGHGDECFSDATTNLLYVNVFRWVVSTSPKGNPFEK